MTDRHDTDRLETLFAAARDAAPLPRGDLLARVEADALAEQARQARLRRVARPGIWPQLRAALGGWPGLAGLAAACAAGIWLGFAAPDLQGFGGGTLADLDGAGLDPLSGFDLAMMGG